MIVAIHQPDLLPYSGFWYKMINSDVFVLAIHDQFQKHGYQRRVKMRDSWVSHQLDGKPSLVPIDSVDVLPGWQGRLSDSIRGRYVGAKHWRDRGGDLIDRIQAVEGTSLVDVNVGLIDVVRDLLQITTPLVTTPPPTQVHVPRLVEEVQLAGGDVYLSGSGGRAYMGPEGEQLFANAGIELRWSDHVHLSGDSIVTIWLEYDDPMTAIMNTTPTGGDHA
jgi:WbqC-like protein family